MKLEFIIIPYWLLIAALIGGSVYIRKFIVVRTLKKYGRDYENYFSIKKQKQQLEEYIDICNENGLSDFHWRYLKAVNKIGLVLMLGWFWLMYLISTQ